jgi:hypothetical protein
MWPSGSQYETQLTEWGVPPEDFVSGYQNGWASVFEDYLLDKDPTDAWVLHAWMGATETPEDVVQFISDVAQAGGTVWDDAVQQAVQAYENSEDIEGEGLAESVVETAQPLLELHWWTFAEAIRDAGQEGAEQEVEEDPAARLERLIGEVAEEVPQGDQDDPSARLEQLVGEVAEEESDLDRAMKAYPFPPSSELRDWIMQISEFKLKDAQDEGTVLPVRQIGDLLLIGDWDDDNTRAEVVASADGHGARTGTITVVSRGSTFSRGELAVQGDFDRNAFKASLREFSKKEITWR